MKKAISTVVVIIIAANVLYSQSGNVVLTEALIHQYVKTFYGFHKLNMELSKISEDMSVSEDRKKALESEYNDKRIKHIQKQGWKTIQLFLDVNLRIQQALMPISQLIKAESASDDEKELMTTRANEILKPYSAAEIAVLKKMFNIIKTMYIKAGITEFEDL